MFKSITITTISALLFFFTNSTSAEEPLRLDIRYNSLPAIATTFAGCHLTNSALVIVLSDGSQWIVRTTSEQDTYDTLFQSWRLGDDIRIKEEKSSDNEDGYFLLKNARNNDLYLASLVNDCFNDSHAFFIEKIDQNGYAIITNNSLEFAIGYLGSFTSCDWMPGDRIIINKSDYSKWEDYRVVNAKDASSCWASLISWK